MNTTKFKACLSLLQGSSNLLPCNLLKCVSKCSLNHAPQRSYYLHVTLGGNKLIHPSVVEPKRDEMSFRSFSFLESVKVRLERKRRIRDILKCSSADANGILQYATTYSSFDDHEMFFEKLECLSKAGVNSTLILANEWLLNVSLGELEKKLEALKSGNCQEFNEIALLKLSRPDLEELMVRLKDDENYSMESRINFFSREFNLSVPEVCELLVERSFLRKKHLHDIISVYKLLLGHGTTPNEIKNDFWVFTYSQELIAARISIARSYNINHFKCWMIRCCPSILKRCRIIRPRFQELRFVYPYRSVFTIQEYFIPLYAASIHSLKLSIFGKQVPFLNEQVSAEIASTNKKILNKYPSKELFLMNELQISEKELLDLYSKYVKLPSVSESKYKRMIDFLLSQNFTRQQISSCLRIMYYSVSKVQERIQELRKLDYDFESLAIVCCNSKVYKRSIAAVKERKEKNTLVLKEKN